MDARLWHQQATAPSIALPPPVRVEVFDEMPAAAQDAYWEVLSSGLATVVLPSALARRAATRLTRLVERNTLRPPGAKAIGSVSAPFAVGKSTFVKDWAQAAYRDLLGPAWRTRGRRGTPNQGSPRTGSRTSTSRCGRPPGSVTCSPRCC